MQVVSKKINKFFFGPIFLDRSERAGPPTLPAAPAA
jgi:hypothetical protein